MYPNASAPRARLATPATSTGLPAPPVEPVRLTLLAAILYNPPIIIGYLLYLYGPSQHCVAGPLCKFGTYPGYLQIVLILLGAYLLWLLLAVGVRRVLESPGWQGWLPRTLRAISDYESVRELLGVLGVVLMVFMVIALLSGRLTPTTLILGAFTAGVSIRAALIRDDPALAAAQPTVAPQPAAPPRAPSAPSTPSGRTPLYSTPAEDTPSASSASYGPPNAPPIPPEFLPPPELLAPSDTTQPSRWEGQAI